VGSMLTLFHTGGPVRSFADASAADTGRFARLHAHCLEHGVYLPPSAYEASFVSLAHGSQEIRDVVDAHASFFAGVPAGG
jgi:glutamate-1-semialdehyde 2,1-aminomutase